MVLQLRRSQTSSSVSLSTQIRFDPRLRQLGSLSQTVPLNDLSQELMHSYDDGVEAITNVDFSKLLIREMLTAHVRQRPKMKWLVMDVTQLKASPSLQQKILP